MSLEHVQAIGVGQDLGPYRIEALLTEAEEGAGTAYRVRIELHQRTTVSYHKKAEEFYFVIAGRGTALLDGRPHELSAGDFLRLPPGTTHAFVTQDAALDLLNIHMPGCRPNRDVSTNSNPAVASVRRHRVEVH